MSSTQRRYAQRDNTIINLSPGPGEGGVEPNTLNLDIVNCRTFNIDIRQVLPVSISPDYLYFNVKYDTTVAAKYPGLEFTVFFDSYNVTYGKRIWIISSDLGGQGIVHDYPLSSSFPVVSYTFKSNGRIFTIVGAGPLSGNVVYLD